MRYKYVFPLLLLIFVASCSTAAVPPYVHWNETTNGLPFPTTPSIVTNKPSPGGIGYLPLSRLPLLSYDQVFTGSNVFQSFGVFNGGLVVGGGAFGGEQFILDSTWMNLLIQSDSHGIALEHYRRDGGFVSILFKAVDDTIHFPNGLNLDNSTATNGQFVGSFAGDAQNAVTNVPIVSSIDIPLGAWFTNNIDTGIGPTITAAQFGSVTNMGDGMVMSHTNGTTAVTNVIRTRFSLPWDWDGNPFKLGIFSVCSSTNSSAATNMMYACRAVSVGPGDNLTNVTFGSFQTVVGNVGTNAWVQGTEAITPLITAGNSPGNTKSLVFEIQRWGGHASDTETNFNLFISQVRVYFKRSTRVDFP